MRVAHCSRVPAALALLAALVGCPWLQRPQPVVELPVEEVDSVAFVRLGDAWATTRRTLYRVQDGKVQPFDSAPGAYDRLMLAPDGEMYARLLAGRGGLFTVELVRISRKSSTGTVLAKLVNPDPPHGFGALYLGGVDKLIVTSTPLDDPERLGGRFLYTFWSLNNLPPAKVILEGRRVGVVDVTGEALLLLGEKDAVAFSKEGRQLWTVDGSFRNGVLAANGGVALLNPNDDDAIGDVIVARGDSRATLRLGSPVYELALTADGAVGAVAADNGQLFFLSPPSCNPDACSARATKPLLSDETFLITAMRFIDSKTLAIGAIRRIRNGSRFSYPSGAALAVNTAGEVLLKTDVSLAQPATWAPSIDVTYGIPTFAARTPHKVLLLTPDR